MIGINLNEFEDWLINKGLKKITIDHYKYYFNKFKHDNFNQKNIKLFLSRKGNKNSVAKSFLLNLKKFLMINYKELGISKDEKLEIAYVELPKITGRLKKRIITPLLIEDIHKIESVFKTEDLKLKLLLSYYCGLRVGGLVKIKVMSFNWETWKKDTSKMGECRVFEKGDKEGIALVPKELMYRVANFIHKENFPFIDSYLFVKTNRAKIKIKSVAVSWHRDLSKAGVEAGITKIGHDGKSIKETAVYPHRLRHSYASHLLNVLGINLLEVKELLRHSNISSTQIYTHIDKSKMKKKLNNLYYKNN